MQKQPLCRPAEHAISRRRMLGGLAGGAAGLGFGSLLQPAIADQIQAKEKQVLLLWLDGGMSQLESWDPKPNTQYGGPFRSISTKLPGARISELMPKIAQRMDLLSVVRTMKTEDPNHSSGIGKILRGHPKNRGVVYPFMGSAVAKLLGPCSSGLPPYVWVKPGNGGFISKYAGFLGAKYGALALGDGKPPENMLPPEGLSEADDLARNRLRKLFNERYAAQHRQNNSEAHSYVYDVAHKLMERADLFDESQLSDADRQRTAPTIWAGTCFWAEGFWKRACGLSKSPPTVGTRTATTSTPTPAGCPRWINRSPPSWTISKTAACWKMSW